MLTLEKKILDFDDQVLYTYLRSILIDRVNTRENKIK